ncbi:NDxxF motif lipoprotein [Peribacillus sp. NPDC096379]|uniref:NDxxF motif lipoprotein n=1 Tax=Peribacillus sp. NPDC096379 TaxID=3364393 RepID=UPI003800A154
MRKLCFSFLILFILSACSQGENIDATEDEIPSTQTVEIPGKIFTSEKQNSVIDEEEMKLSIKTYLDSHDELDNASYPFQEIIDEEKELNKNELEKLAKITKLTKENDENFSNYILNNTLPEGYQEESERISQYITAYNELLSELDEILSNFTDDINKEIFSKINIESIMNKSDVVNGREQKKIEEFLDKKNIKTKAFGRDH